MYWYSTEHNGNAKYRCCHKYSTKVLKYKYKYSGLKSTLSTSTST